MRAKQNKPSSTGSESSVGHLWKTALPQIRLQVGDDNFNAWIAPLEASGDADKVTLAAPTGVISASVNRHFVPLISKVLTEIRGHSCTVQVSARTSPPERTEQSHEDKTWTDSEATFDRFVVGESNKDAYHHARAVASGEFRGPRPLVLFGWVGLGKTHLAGAIANAIREKRPNCRVICQPSTEFVVRVLAAMRGDQQNSSWDEVREAAILILDDVHFLAGHAATQDALVRVFSVLHERGTPVVLTSDRAPQEIPDIEKRLRQSFESGVLARVNQPESDLRRRILLQKAADRGVDLPDEVAEFLAERVVGSGRTLEGILTRVKAFALAQNPSADPPRPITCGVAAKALRAFQPAESSITPEFIRTAVSEVLGIPRRVLASGRRTREVTRARQLAMYLCRKHCGLPLTEIARRFGRRDHSTVLHACTVMEDKRTHDAALDAAIRRIEELIQMRQR